MKMLNVFIMGLLLSLCTNAYAQDLYKFWKKRNLDLATEAGCMRVLELMNYDAKTKGNMAAIQAYAETAKAIRGKTESCQNVKLGTAMVSLALDGYGNKSIQGYEYLRQAAETYHIDIPYLLPPKRR